MTKLSAWATLASNTFLYPLGFCFYWNVLGVHSAIGHGLGTVNYWTALGVEITVTLVVCIVALAAYGAISQFKKFYEILTAD